MDTIMAEKGSNHYLPQVNTVNDSQAYCQTSKLLDMALAEAYDLAFCGRVSFVGLW